MKTQIHGDSVAARLEPRIKFLAPKLHRVGEFLGLQGITTAGNLLYGFLCVRLLPIPDYAEFAVVFGFLGTLTVLMDIGISSTLLPLVGERIDDSQLIADYVASLRQLAHWLYLVAVPIVVIVYPLLVQRQQWSWKVVAAMVAIVLAAGWSARVSGAYGAVLILRRDHTFWYRTQIVSSLGTLLLLGVVWSVHWLNAFSAILINVSGIAYCGTAYYLRACRLLRVKGRPSKEKRMAILHLALPIIPNAIFYAFQGQISLLLIVWFGHLRAVAGLGALNRLSRVFVLFSQINPLFLEPYFAKLPRTSLKKNYFGVVAVESSFSVAAAGLALFFPQVFLWVLGPKYSNLRFEVFLLIATSAITSFYGALWTIHTARRFVYWWSGAAVIVASLGIESIFILKADLSTIRSVLVLNLTVASAELIINVLSGIYGFIHGPRESEKPTAIPQEAGCT